MSIHPSHLPHTLDWQWSATAGQTDHTFCALCHYGLIYTHGQLSVQALAPCGGVRLTPGTHMVVPVTGPTGQQQAQAFTIRHAGAKITDDPLHSSVVRTACEAQACSCDMRDLMSNGHVSGCPAKGEAP